MLFHTKQKPEHPTRQVNPALRQQGSVLMVSLLILLVMTIVGVSTMGTNLLNQKMASNNQDMIITFQAAASGNGHCIAESRPVDSRMFEAIISAVRNIGNLSPEIVKKKETAGTLMPVMRSYSLDYTTTGDCSTHAIRRNHHMNSSMDLFIGYDLEYTGTGKIPATNSKAVTAQGAQKGPFPTS